MAACQSVLSGGRGAEPDKAGTTLAPSRGARRLQPASRSRRGTIQTGPLAESRGGRGFAGAGASGPAGRSRAGTPSSLGFRPIDIHQRQAALHDHPTGGPASCARMGDAQTIAKAATAKRGSILMDSSGEDSSGENDRTSRPQHRRRQLGEGIGVSRLRALRRPVRACDLGALADVEPAPNIRCRRHRTLPARRSGPIGARIAVCFAFHRHCERSDTAGEPVNPIG